MILDRTRISRLNFDLKPALAMTNEDKIEEAHIPRKNLEKIAADQIDAARGRSVDETEADEERWGSDDNLRDIEDPEVYWHCWCCGCREHDGWC